MVFNMVKFLRGKYPKNHHSVTGHFAKTCSKIQWARHHGHHQTRFGIGIR